MLSTPFSHAALLALRQKGTQIASYSRAARLRAENVEAVTEC